MKDHILNFFSRIAFSFRAFREAWMVSKQTYAVCFSYGGDDKGFPDYMKKGSQKLFKDAVKKFAK